MVILIRHLWNRELWYNCLIIWYRIYLAHFILTVYIWIVSHMLDMLGSFYV